MGKNHRWTQIHSDKHRSSSQIRSVFIRADPCPSVIRFISAPSFVVPKLLGQKHSGKAAVSVVAFDGVVAA